MNGWIGNNTRVVGTNLLLYFLFVIYTYILHTQHHGLVLGKMLSILFLIVTWRIIEINRHMLLYIETNDIYSDIFYTVNDICHKNRQNFRRPDRSVHSHFVASTGTARSKKKCSFVPALALQEFTRLCDTYFYESENLAQKYVSNEFQNCTHERTFFRACCFSWMCEWNDQENVKHPERTFLG